MQPARYKTLGIIGGMGPWATADFFAKIVSQTYAARDQDHIPIIVHSVPQIPDRSAAILVNSDAPAPFLLNSLQTLEQAGAEILVMPCNTAHHWYPTLAAAASRPFIHVVDAVAETLRAGNCDRVGLLATRGLIASGVYQKRLAGAMIAVSTPSPAEQLEVDAVIDAVKAGHTCPAPAIEAAQGLLARGARRVILGCTELPIAFAGAGIADNCLDATAVLARASITACGGRLRDGSQGHPDTIDGF